MIYSKYLWIFGIACIGVGFMGITQGKLISGLGFFPLALSAFSSYDKRNPKVSNKKLREGLFIAGLALAFIIWFIGPRLFPS
jgi:hypothetical protein